MALFPITAKKAAPDDAGDGDHGPIQRAEEKTLDRVSVFVGAKADVLSRVWGAEKNEDPQRQPPVISRQAGDDAAAEPYAREPYAAAEEYQQTGEVDRQAPGELNEIEQCPGPARGGDPLLRAISGVVHTRDLFLFGVRSARVPRLSLMPEHSRGDVHAAAVPVEVDAMEAIAVCLNG